MKREILCCYYEYDKSCIIIGGILENNHVLIKKVLSLQCKTHEEIRDLLNDNSQDKEIAEFMLRCGRDIWINNDKYLARALGLNRERQIGSLSNFAATESLFKALRATDRFLSSEELSGNISRFQDCLLILLDAIGCDLFEPEMDGDTSISTSGEREIYHVISCWT